MMNVHVHLRQDLSLYLLLSGQDLDYFQGSISPYIRDIDHGPCRLWVCLEIISKNSKQVSSIQQITHVNQSQVGFGSMTILAEADDRCRLRVLLSTSKKKPLKPGMIMGEWFFNFRSLTAYAVYKQGLQLKMRHKLGTCSHFGADNAPGDWIGTLRFTVTPAPAFSSSERGQNILEQFPEPHPSNPLTGIFTLPPDLSPTKKSGNEVLQATESPPELSSILDLCLTFKEPDEFTKPELLIRRVFRNLKRELRLLIFVGVRHPVRYIRGRRQVS
ncbi:hypothetical protein F4604DRAFT_671449 [Suillus subluteus]|nr:hypothetical protein F4604DRAFT_671449 [Suillus subluteus]